MGKIWRRTYIGNSASITPDRDEHELARAGIIKPCPALQSGNAFQTHYIMP